MVFLTPEPIDFHALTESVRSAHCGAVVLFLGTVRDLTGDRVTAFLDYEAYAPMAGRKMAEIEAEARRRWPVGEVAMVHRVGRLTVGEVSVAVAVSAPHRGEAFEACRFAIDTLKELVPIWKKENAPDGSGEWVEGAGKPGLAPNSVLFPSVPCVASVLCDFAPCPKRGLMSDVPTIYLARHGETEWSRVGRHTGRTDVPLTPKGEADAARIGRRLAGIDFTHVLTSPLGRARRTCELAGFAGLVDPNLVEWDYGEYEGLTSAEIKDRRPGWELFHDGCSGGESVLAMAARVDGVAERLKALTGNVLVFAHGHLLRVLASRWLGQPLSFSRSLLLSTASTCILGFDHQSQDEPAIALWNQPS